MSKYRVLVADSNEFLASFDFSCEAIECAIQFAESIGKETCVMEVKSTYKPVLDSYEAAKIYLGEDAKDHQKALLALEKLMVIAEAWNKHDRFVPIFGAAGQYGWFPFFEFDNKSADFVCAGAADTAVYADDTAFGSRLCFKTEKRAEQFGEQFIDLWNDFLLYR